jgi:hypothetical protein
MYLFSAILLCDRYDSLFLKLINDIQHKLIHFEKVIFT